MRWQLWKPLHLSQMGSSPHNNNRKEVINSSDKDLIKTDTKGFVASKQL